MHNDVYFNKYKELLDLIGQAIVDFSVLKEMDNYNAIVKEEQKALPSDSSFVMKHFCLLTKEDFALTVWKLCDTDKKANSVFNLRGFVKKELNRECHYKLSEKANQVRHELTSLRHQFLAHNDSTRAIDSVKLNDLYGLLGELCAMLEEMRYPDIDDRIPKMQETGVAYLSSKTRHGLQMLICPALVQNNE